MSRREPDLATRAANTQCMGAVSDGSTFFVPLRGAGGEPVSLRATVGSHGLAWLPPNTIAPDGRALETTLLLRDGTARRIGLAENAPGMLAVRIFGRAPGERLRDEIATTVRAMFALDENLAPFYARLADDADLAFACVGAGRLLRSPSAFEDVVRTICTTNCAWSGTQRMIGALVAQLGTRAADAPRDSVYGRAFPSAAQLAAADESFFRDVARAGYRGAYLRALATSVASGALDLEAWRAAPRSELSDVELEGRLLSLPGVGPYAAAHTMMLFGRCSRLVFDSWTRPRYAELLGKNYVSDRTIERRFKRYGEHAGRAFWLLLWKSRHLDEEPRA